MFIGRIDIYERTFKPLHLKHEPVAPCLYQILRIVPNLDLISLTGEITNPRCNLRKIGIRLFRRYGIGFKIRGDVRRLAFKPHISLAKRLEESRRIALCVGIGNAAFDMRGDILAHFLVGRRNIARDVEIVAVLLDLVIRNHPGIVRFIRLRFPCIGNPADVALAQAVLRSVLGETVLRVDHENALRLERVLLVENDDARRNARTEEKIRRKPDDTADDSFLDDELADLPFGIAAKENAVRKDDCALAL